MEFIVLLIVGFIAFMFVVEVVAAMVNAVGLKDCPACDSEISKKAKVCPHCQTVLVSPAGQPGTHQP